jgi:hypothetical protein
MVMHSLSSTGPTIEPRAAVPSASPRGARGRLSAGSSARRDAPVPPARRATLARSPASVDGASRPDATSTRAARGAGTAASCRDDATRLAGRAARRGLRDRRAASLGHARGHVAAGADSQRISDAQPQQPTRRRGQRSVQRGRSTDHAVEILRPGRAERPRSLTRSQPRRPAAASSLRTDRVRAFLGSWAGSRTACAVRPGARPRT